MKTKSTTEKIAALLKRGRSITPMQALDQLNCMRLGARIYDLKKQGYRINKTPHKTPGGKIVAKYSLA